MWDAKSQGPLSVFPKDINSDHNVRGNLNEYRKKEKKDNFIAKLYRDT